MSLFLSPTQWNRYAYIVTPSSSASFNIYLYVEEKKKSENETKEKKTFRLSHSLTTSSSPYCEKRKKDMSSSSKSEYDLNVDTKAGDDADDDQLSRDEKKALARVYSPKREKGDFSVPKDGFMSTDPVSLICLAVCIGYVCQS